jgi:biotin carboxylase
MNLRIQVEHTVTEEVTDVDLVQAQLRIASGETLSSIGLTQASVQVCGAALQCRITSEDPENGFRPDTGRISTHRTRVALESDSTVAPGSAPTSALISTPYLSNSPAAVGISPPRSRGHAAHWRNSGFVESPPTFRFCRPSSRTTTSCLYQ